MMTDTGNTTLIVSHIVVDTGLPCEDIGDNPDDCECDRFETDPNYGFTLDDLIIYPDIPGMGYQRGHFGPTQTLTGIRATRIDYDDLLYNDNNHDGIKDDDNGLIPRNNEFNCELIKKGGVPSSNNLIITELFFDQPQLFGFPLISNPFTDPVPLYTHTAMRLTSATRSSGYGGGGLTDDINTIGPVCDAFPFIVATDTIKFGTDDKLNQKVDILDGPDSSDWGFLAWNPASYNDKIYLGNELKYSTISLNDFTNARVSSDHALSVGDYVASFQGVTTGIESSDGLISALVGKKIRIPVWDSFDTSGSPDAYHIVGFAWVQIESSGDIALTPHKEVMAKYLGDASDACP